MKCFSLLRCLLICAFFSTLPAAYAATPEILKQAQQCAALTPKNRERDGMEQWNKDKINCLKNLYVTVSDPTDTAEVRAEIQRRLDTLHQAFIKARMTCHIRQQHEAQTNGCGTIGLAYGEFHTLLKDMILNEDAGWVRVDERLKKALGVE